MNKDEEEEMMMKMYLGVVQDTPVFVRVALVISTCENCDEEKEKGARDQNFSRSNGFSAERDRQRRLVIQEPSPYVFILSFDEKVSGESEICTF